MSARILIVDDNPLNLKMLGAKLAHEYYIVSTAESGQEAIDKARVERPDIILLDVMMPGMNGFDTCKELRSLPETEYIPVVMVTALSDISDRVKGLEAGADDFLSKPINDVALMARVRSLLRLKVMMDEWRLREITTNQLGVLPRSSAGKIDISGGGHALLVDTDPYQKDNIQQILKAANITISSVPTIVEATALINQKSFDLLICSIDLGDEDGLLLCSLLRAQPVTRQLPILLMAQEGDMARIAKGLDLGANDYIMRPIDANELLARARTQLKQKKHYEQIRKNYEESFMMALIDPLTGAYNRRYLDAHLPRLLERLVPSEKPLSILMIDIDHFKIINDTHGHAIGDAVLKEVVARIMNGLRPSDLVVRMGGEEFAVVLPETSLERGKSVAERIRARVEATPTGANANGDVVRTTISIGISCVPMGVEEPAESLLNRADKALYEAKHTGRNKVVSAK